MLKHVREANSADSILGGMNVPTGVLERTLDDKGRRITSFRCTSVVRAGVATLGLNVWDGAVLDVVNVKPIMCFSFNVQQSQPS